MKFINDNALRDMSVKLFQSFGKDVDKKILELEKRIDALAVRRGRPPKDKSEALLLKSGDSK